MGSAFDDTVREHGPAIWRVIASYAPPGPERDDLAQDVLLAAWQALRRFRGRRPQTAEVDVPDPRPGPDEQVAALEGSERFLRPLRALPWGSERWSPWVSAFGDCRNLGITPENVAEQEI